MSKVSCATLAIFIFVLGGAVGYFVATTNSAHSERSEETDYLFNALVQQSQAIIPKSKLHCDLPGTQIADFITSYIRWSQARTPNSFSKLSCEGESIKKCSWAFGEAKEIEGSSRFLQFEYNSQKQVIVPSSLECFDVP